MPQNRFDSPCAKPDVRQISTRILRDYVYEQRNIVGGMWDYKPLPPKPQASVNGH